MPEEKPYPELLGAIEALGFLIDQKARPRGDGVQFVLDTDLPKGWCQFIGRDGIEYAGPLSRMPAGALADRMRIAPDVWEDLRRRSSVPRHQTDPPARDSGQAAGRDSVMANNQATIDKLAATHPDAIDFDASVDAIKFLQMSPDMPPPDIGIAGYSDCFGVKCG